jgi:uncharacterized protein
VACLISHSMRWTKGYRSGDVVDRRGEPGFRPGMGNLGGMAIPLLGRFGWRGILLAVGLMLVIGYCSQRGEGPPDERSQSSQSSSSEEAAVPADEMSSFVGFVLDDAQGTWERIFAAAGKDYRRAKLVLFSGSTSTRCGLGAASSGPFYCPNDANLYIDLSFYRELRDRFGAPGDFAQAYVIAHEVGHHVQKQLGLLGRGGIAVELQADCFAGVWAHSTRARGNLEEGDFEEAMTAAASVGDDSIQQRETGTVHPETWTHGSAEQRKRWFNRGYQSGDPDQCDTSSER